MVLLQILKILNFRRKFSCHHHFGHQSQSGPDFSEMNNDADLLFDSGVTTDDMLLKCGQFICDGGPYSYLDFKM